MENGPLSHAEHGEHDELAGTVVPAGGALDPVVLQAETEQGDLLREILPFQNPGGKGQHGVVHESSPHEQWERTSWNRETTLIPAGQASMHRPHPTQEGMPKVFT